MKIYIINIQNISCQTGCVELSYCSNKLNIYLIKNQANKIIYIIFTTYNTKIKYSLKYRNKFACNSTTRMNEINIKILLSCDMWQ